MADLTLDTTRLETALGAYMAGSRRELPAVIRQVSRGVLRKIIATTPPARASASGKSAKAMGAMTIRADLARAFQPVSDARFASIEKRGNPGGRPLLADQSALAAYHQSVRRQDGRVAKRKTREKAIVRTADYRAHLEATLRKSGNMASGWKTAAASLGITLPAWITRNSAPGAIRHTATDGDVSTTMENLVSYGPNLRGIHRRIQSAIDGAAADLEKQTARYLDRLAVRFNSTR